MVSSACFDSAENSFYQQIMNNIEIKILRKSENIFPFRLSENKSNMF